MLAHKSNGKKLKPAGFGRTASGKLNAKMAQGKDVIDIDTNRQLQLPDVPTLKKPLPKFNVQEMEVTMDFYREPENKLHITLEKFKKDPQNKVLSCLYGIAASKNEVKHINLETYDPLAFGSGVTQTFVETDNMDLLLKMDKTIKKPIVVDNEQKPMPAKINNFIDRLDDGNSVISAYIRKNYDDLPKIDNVDKIDVVNTNKAAQAGQNKLRQMFNKKPTQETTKKQAQVSKKPSDRFSVVSKHSDQDIEQILQQDYLKQSFEKSSQIKQSIAKESDIKQSIRESISYSKPDKSIKQQIKQSISKSKQSISQSIHEVSQRPKKKPNEDVIEESIEEVYDDDFDEASVSISAIKQSHLTPPKNSISEQSMSKSFRKKKSAHTPHIGSIKLAEEINMRQSKEFGEFVRQNQKRFEKVGLKQQHSHMKDIIQEKQEVSKLQQEVKDLLGRTKTIHEKWKKDEFQQKDRYSKQRVNNLYYRFQSQLTRLINDQDLHFKLKKLTSFIPQNAQPTVVPDGMDNILLSRILDAITNLRETALDYNGMRKMQEEYEKKMDRLLKNQQRLMRMELQRKLDERDNQIKKLIQALSTKQYAGPTGRDKILDVLRKGRPSRPDSSREKRYSQEDLQYSKRFDESSATKKDIPELSISMDKDYSYEFDAVSWDSSLDLWENLKEQDKRKLYEKQSQKVTDFLTSMVLREIKEQALKRSLDVSFEFPSDTQKLPSLKTSKIQEEDEFKPAFDRKSIEDQLSQSGGSEQEYVKPEYPPPKPAQPKTAPTHVPQEQKEQQIHNRQPQKDIKTVEKAKRVTSKYNKKLISKKQKTIKKLIKQIKQDKPIRQAMYGFTILQDKQIDDEDKVILRAYEQNIIQQLIGFINNHKLPQKKLEAQLQKRFDRIVAQSGQVLIEDVSKVIPIDAEEQKDTRLPIKDKIKKYQTKSMIIEQPEAQSFVEYDNQRDWKQIRKHIEDQIIQNLVADAATQLRRRK